ncbi:MAG: hypothetical protein F6K55_20150 [Moorea sp. SIO4A3]|nr:hypothetical protein [Moorena sp. SIO4A3]
MPIASMPLASCLLPLAFYLLPFTFYLLLACLLLACLLPKVYCLKSID